MTIRRVVLAAIWASGACTTMLACNALVGFDGDYVLAPLDESVVGSDGSSSAEASNNGGGGDVVPDGDVPDGDVPDGDVPDGEGGTPSPSDAGTDSPDEEKLIHCGSPTDTCSVGAQTCCPFVTGGYHCKDTSDCRCVNKGSCSSQLRLDCDDETDCDPGYVCCGHLDNSNYPTGTVTCVPAGTCGGLRPVLLCDPSNPRCPDDGGCVPFKENSLPGVGRCQ